MAPASTAGAIAQLNAEVLAGIAYAQLVRPGAPMVYGMFATTVSMQSGAPMMGTPEPAQMIYVATQLARKYGVPVRAGGMLNGSKIADAQAAYEFDRHHDPDADGRHEFRPAFGRLAGGGPRRGLRQVHARRRPDRHAAELRRGRRISRRRAGRWRRSAKSGPAATISAAPTPSATSRRRSIRRRSPTTTATSSGRPRAPRTPTSAPPKRRSACWPNTSRRRSTPPSTRRCWISWPGARRNCRTP